MRDGPPHPRSASTCRLQAEAQLAVVASAEIVRVGVDHEAATDDGELAFELDQAGRITPVAMPSGPASMLPKSPTWHSAP